MSEVLAVTLPFFVLVGLGYAAARLRLLPLEAISGLNVFVLYFALPCMLFQFGAQTPIAQLFDPVVLGLWLAVALIMVGSACLLARQARLPWRDAAFGALVATFPNTGFMGVPLLFGLLGAAAAGPTIATVMLDMVVTSSLCVALAHLGAGQAQGQEQEQLNPASQPDRAGSGLRAVRQALLGVAKNPMPWSVLAGALASAVHWLPPKPVATTVGLLAAAAAPVALFRIGAVLWRSRLESLIQPGKLGESINQDVNQGVSPDMPASAPPEAPRQRRLQTRDWIALVLLKLVLHPLLVAAGLWLLARAGVPVSPVVQAALLLIAALPSAGNVALLAERFGADNGRVARVILWTTLLAVLSFNAVVLVALPKG